MFSRIYWGACGRDVSETPVVSLVTKAEKGGSRNVYEVDVEVEASGQMWGLLWSEMWGQMWSQLGQMRSQVWTQPREISSQVEWQVARNSGSVKSILKELRSQMWCWKFIDDIFRLCSETLLEIHSLLIYKSAFRIIFLICPQGLTSSTIVTQPVRSFSFFIYVGTTNSYIQKRNPFSVRHPSWVYNAAGEGEI